MKRQITVKVDHEIEGAMDLVAAKQGLSRTEFLRNLILESLAADREERPLFAPSEKPSLPSNFDELVPRLQDCIIELDRAQRENQKHTKRYLDAFNGGEEAYQHALEKLTSRLVAQRKEANEPFLIQLSELRSDFGALPQAIGERVGDQIEAQLQPMCKRLAVIETAARAPRMAHNVIIGEEFVQQWRVILPMFGLCLLAGMIITMIAGNFIPSVGRTLANQFVDDDVALCRQLKVRFPEEECAMPDLRRRNALIAIKLEQAP